MSYDGRKDKNRAKDTTSGKMKMVRIKDEHVSVTEEPSERYLDHFVPDIPVHPEKPALKVAQSLYETLKECNSLDSLQIIQGDSTAVNTGWKGGSHAHL